MKGYSIKIVITIDTKGRDVKDYIEELKTIALTVYDNVHFEVNSQSYKKEYGQITFIPIRANGVPDLDTLNLFALLLKKQMPAFDSIVFHNEKGFNWGTTSEESK